MVLKRIRDKKALSEAQIVHLERYRIPNYQWGAIGVNSRFKLIAYSREKSWTNGLRWYLWVIFWLRSHGVTAEIVFTVDNGEEFGGKSWMKVKELRKLTAGFGCRLIQNHKGHCEEAMGEIRFLLCLIRLLSKLAPGVDTMSWLSTL